MTAVSSKTTGNQRRWRGVLPVSKPSGISSYDVIRQLRPLVPPRTRLGHAGTLDPLAQGLLLILIGAATKVSRFLMDSDKEYHAVVRFGIRTDADDITGQVIEQAPVPDIGTDRLTATLGQFVGTIEQTPPAFAAIKQQGQSQYKLARAGQPVVTRPRRVTIHSLQLLAWQTPRLQLRCRVSSGTYIRALARDIGIALAVPATLEELTRTKVGIFTLDQAVSLATLSTATIPDRLVSIPDALADWPRVEIDADGATRLLRGQRVLTNGNCPGRLLAHTTDDRFLAVVNGGDRYLQPERIVYAD